MMSTCPDEKYFFERAKTGVSPCELYESCDECPCYSPEAEEGEEDE